MECCERARQSGVGQSAQQAAVDPLMLNGHPQHLDHQGFCEAFEHGAMAAACGRALSGTSMCGWGLLAPPR